MILFRFAAFLPGAENSPYKGILEKLHPFGETLSDIPTFQVLIKALVGVD